VSAVIVAPSSGSAITGCVSPAVATGVGVAVRAAVGSRSVPQPASASTAPTSRIAWRAIAGR
jgi:hypothetical protein